MPGVRYALDSRRTWLAVAGAVVVLAATVGGLAWLSSGGTSERPRVAIVDQLAMTDPNPDFVVMATRELQDAGYSVYYYPSKTVTVDLYRGLPSHDYKFVLLRSHASESVGRIDPLTGKFTGQFTESSGLFTSELYRNNRYVDDQRTGRLMVDSYIDRPIKDSFFGITPAFITSAVRGQFHDTTIVLMGCSGLKTDDLAKAFVSRGVKDFVSWDGSVTAEHTDAAATALLKNIFSARLGVREAVALTMQQTGADPAFGSHLVVYP
jgi:hypothetical protein